MKDISESKPPFLPAVNLDSPCNKNTRYDDDGRDRDSSHDADKESARETRKAVAIAAKQEDEEDDGDDDPPPGSLWDKDGWQLTWPIWHMLPQSERKDLAFRHGYKTIGDFEEFMSLQQTLEDSTDRHKKPYRNENIYSKATLNTKAGATEEDKKPAAFGDEDDESEEEEEEDVPDKLAPGSDVSDQKSSLTVEELIAMAGQILILHDEILHQIFAWLPVDAYGVLAIVSPHWKHLTRTEPVYKRLCERLYLNQSKRRQLHVSRFGGSYRRMLELRPRVRAAGGCYVLKYSSVKKIQRDMWTDIPIGAILETVYYRYLYFQEDGRVLYALTSAPPHEMFRRLLKICLQKVEDPAAVWGTFQVQKNSLKITARQSWHTVQFELTIETESMYGRFASLRLDRHLSSKSGCFDYWSNDRVDYEVPIETFRFIRSGRL